MPYSKTIFVMEDVDAAASVVQRRAATDPFAHTPSRASLTAAQSKAGSGAGEGRKGGKGGRQRGQKARSGSGGGGASSSDDEGGDKDQVRGGVDGARGTECLDA